MKNEEKSNRIRTPAQHTDRAHASNTTLILSRNNSANRKTLVGDTSMQSPMPPQPPQKSEVRKAELKVARLEAQLVKSVRLGKVLAKLATQLNRKTEDARARESLASFVRGVDGQLDDLAMSSAKRQGLGRVTVRSAFAARSGSELSVSGGDVLEVLKLHEAGWLYGRRAKGVAGWVPLSFCRVMGAAEGMREWRPLLSKWHMTEDAHSLVIPDDPPPLQGPALPPRRGSAVSGRPLAPTPTSTIPSVDVLSTSPKNASPATRPLIPKKPSLESTAKSMRRSMEVPPRRMSESVLHVTPPAPPTPPAIDADFLADLISEVQLLELEEIRTDEEEEEYEDPGGGGGGGGEGSDEDSNGQEREREDKRATLSLDMDECSSMLGALNNLY
jgi:hypothetical protein